MSPAHELFGRARGYIIPVGGAADEVNDGAILRRFVSVSGGPDGNIAIVPTASRLPETGPRYEALFRRLGAGEARAVPFATRGDCEHAPLLDALAQATGVFLAGGDQLRLAATLGGTSAATLLRHLNAGGVPVAGTSAGAAFLAEHMIAFGPGGGSPRAHGVTLAPGLGLTNAVIVDQHFHQRNRLGRLLMALAYNPFAVGIGLDEDTAAFMGPDDVLEIVGSGAATVLDPGAVEFSSISEARAGEPVCLVGMRLHVLVQGWTFDLGTRQARASTSSADLSAVSSRESSRRIVSASAGPSRAATA